MATAGDQTSMRRGDWRPMSFPRFLLVCFLLCLWVVLGIAVKFLSWAERALEEEVRRQFEARGDGEMFEALKRRIEAGGIGEIFAEFLGRPTRVVAAEAGRPGVAAAELPRAWTDELRSRKKFYAVRRGHTPGIYLSWEDCRRQVDGFSGSRFKCFKSPWDAEEFMMLREG